MAKQPSIDAVDICRRNITIEVRVKRKTELRLRAWLMTLALRVAAAVAPCELSIRWEDGNAV
jgi:hypothetical protein